MRADGTDQRKIISASANGAMFASPVWSPDGRWIAYGEFRYGAYSNEAWIELFNLEHGTTSVVISEPRLDLASQMAGGWAVALRRGRTSRRARTARISGQ